VAMGSLGTAESKLLAVRLINDARHFAVAEVGQGCRRNLQDMLEGFMPTSRNRKINMKMKFAVRDVL